MNHPAIAQLRYDQIGLQIATRLAASVEDDAMEHDVLERLRVARQQAVARRKVVAPVTAAGIAVSSGGTAALHFNEGVGQGLWGRLGTVLPLLALVAGLLTIYVGQNDDRADEVAEIDSALLTDDLPPAAYTDPGFIQFLKTSTPTTPR